MSAFFFNVTLILNILENQSAFILLFDGYVFEFQQDLQLFKYFLNAEIEIVQIY